MNINVSDTIGVFEGVNRITNGSFESDTASNGTIPSGWTSFGSSPNTYKGVANDFGRDGSKSFKLSATTTNDSGIRINLTGMVSGRTYIVAVYARSTSAVDTGSFVVSNEQNGSGGNQTSTNNWSGAYDGWRFITWTPNTTAWEIFLGFGAFGAASDGTVWFDDVRVMQFNTMSLQSHVNKSESITLTESVELEVTTSAFINKSENITVSENVGLNIPGITYSVNVNDRISVYDTLAQSRHVYEPTWRALSEGSLLRDASHTPSNEYVQLTAAQNDQSGELEFDEDIGFYDLDIKYDWFSGGGDGADAQWFYFGAADTPFTEEDDHGGYTIDLDEYTGDNGGNTTQFWFQGTRLALEQTGVDHGIDFDNSTWRFANFQWKNGILRVYINTTLVMEHDDSTADPRTLAGNRFGWGARTGGLNNIHRIRNLIVESLTKNIAVVTPAAGDLDITVSDSITLTESIGRTLVHTVNKSESITLSESFTVRKNIAGLIDNFNDNSLDTALWSNWSPSNLSEQNSRIEIVGSTSAAYFGFDSKDRWDLTGSAIFSELVDAGNQSITSWEAYPIQLFRDSNNKLEWGVAGGNVFARKVVAGSFIQVWSDTYNSAVHKWFRIRESGGTTFWDHSPDGINWTNVHSESNPIGVNDFIFEFLVGTWQAEALTTMAAFDNVNFVLNRLVSETENITVSESVTVAPPLLSISETENITVTENVSVNFGEFALNVSDEVDVSESVNAALALQVHSPNLHYSTSFSTNALPAGWAEYQGSWAYSSGTVVNTNSGDDPTHLLYETTGPNNRVVQATITIDDIQDFSRFGIGIHIGTAAGGRGINLVFRGDNDTLSFLDDLVTWGPGVSKTWANGQTWIFKAMYLDGTYYGKAWLASGEEPAGWDLSWVRTAPSGTTYPGLAGIVSNGNGQFTYDNFSWTGIPDTITVSENVDPELNSFISKSESITVSENAVVDVIELVSDVTVSDSITVSESRKIELQSHISESESIEVTESVSLDIPINIAVSENISVTESLSVAIQVAVSEEETITVAEQSNVVLVHQISVSEEIEVTEAVDPELVNDISVSDEITLDEHVAVMMGDFNVLSSDIVGITESVSLLIPVLFLTTSDSITVSESIFVQPEIKIAVSDEIEVTESTNVTHIYDVSVSDSITLDESSKVELEAHISVSDGITLSESVSLDVPITINESETITLTENVLLEVSDVLIAVADNITVTEAIDVDIEVKISVSDSIVLTEFIDVLHNSTRNLSVAESITVTDVDNIALVSLISVDDDITLSEALAMNGPHLRDPAPKFYIDQDTGDVWMITVDKENFAIIMKIS